MGERVFDLVNGSKRCLSALRLNTGYVFRRHSLVERVQIRNAQNGVRFRVRTKQLRLLAASEEER